MSSKERRKVTEDSFLWGLFAVIILFDLYISAIKAAFTYARLPYLLSLKEQNESDLDRAIKVMERPRVRTTLRLAMMTTHLLAGGLLVLGLSRSVFIDANTWIFVLCLVGALFVLALLEYLIEGAVLKSPESAVLKLARPALVLDFVYTPLAWMTTALLGEKASVATLETMTEAELRNWVEEGQPQGSLEKGERQMIYSIFHFGDTFAREVMVPRVDVLAVDVTSTIGEARQALLNSGHSRVPVFEDTVDNVIGLLYAKDLLAVQNDDLTLDSQRQILRGAYFVPEAKKVDELLEEMQARGVHMALVVDEYGGVAGVVTLEDIVEEIVGEIRDEYDDKEENLFQLINEHEYLFSGRISLDDFNEMMDSQVSAENADSLGGFIYGELGHVPLQGETITIDGITLKVENVIGRRILKVRATKDQPISLSGDEAYAD
jgi:CBS domain containing-hemolysin-like protein